VVVVVVVVVVVAVVVVVVVVAVVVALFLLRFPYVNTPVNSKMQISMINTITMIQHCFFRIDFWY